MLTYYLITGSLTAVWLYWFHKPTMTRVDEPLGVDWIEQRLPLWERWDALECASRGVNMFVSDASGRPLVRVVKDERVIQEREQRSRQMDVERAEREALRSPKVRRIG